MPFFKIEFNLEALRKLAERGISVEEVTEVFQLTPGCLDRESESSRREQSLVDGPTRIGRFLTIIVDRDRADHGLSHVMTAWDSTEPQVRLYRNAL